jgi:hypothetical protein
MQLQASKVSHQRHDNLHSADDQSNILMGRRLDGDPARVSRRWNSVAWGGAGFVAGALFWHSIGFWSFIQTTLVPSSDMRRVERDVGGEARGQTTQTTYSPIRPLKTTNKIAGKHQPTSTAVAAEPVTVAASPRPLVEPQSDCIVILRGSDGVSSGAQPCSTTSRVLTEGAGLRLADKQPVKPLELSKSAPLVWSAKVEVAADAQ